MQFDDGTDYQASKSIKKGGELNGWSGSKSEDKTYRAGGYQWYLVVDRKISVVQRALTYRDLVREALEAKSI
jgi:hypothetical protein